MEYILASKSPRRISLLKQIGINFKSVDSNVNEFESNYHCPVSIVKHNSKLKAYAIRDRFKNRIIIAADTVVYINKLVLHKPANKKEAFRYLKILSNKFHTVYTGIYLINNLNNKEIFDYEKTKVKFRKLSDNEIRYYIKYYNPTDKAGAYGIQEDFGCLFIEKVVGDYYNVVGLPLTKLYLNLLRI
ncbi:MAG: septum formation protein Maf [Ignavibacteria bacterium]|nr:septum formation protein Maf [Ignavibacteria bacterium]